MQLIVGERSTLSGRRHHPVQVLRALACIMVFTLGRTGWSQTTYTWTGATDIWWNNMANWSPNSGFPGPLDQAVIVSGPNPAQLDSPRSVTGLTVSSGTLDLGTNTLQLTGNGTFTNGTLTNGTLSFNGPSATIIFSGTGISAALSGTAASIRFNGSVFSNTIGLIRTGAGTDVCNGGNTFGGPVQLTQAGTGTWSLANSGADTYQQGLALASTGSGIVRFGATGGTSSLLAGTTLSIAPAGFSSGQLILRGFTQLGGTAQNLVLTGSATLVIDNGTVFNGPLTATAPSFYLNGGTFQSDVTFTKTGTTTDVSAGGSVYNGQVDLINTGAGQWYLHNSLSDQFNGDLRLTNTGGGFRLGGTTGGATLQAGRTISMGVGGYSSGILYLRNFVQSGTTAQNINCTGNVQLHFLPGTVFGGDLTASSPRMFLNGGTFNGNSSFTKTGNTNDLSAGGCTFNATATFTSTGAGQLYLHNSGSDQFNGDVRVNCVGGAGIRFGASTGTSVLASGRTIEVGGSGFTSGQLVLRGMTQVGTATQQLLLGSAAELQFGAGADLSGPVIASSGALYLNGSIFRNTASFTKTGSTLDASTGGCQFQGVTTFTQAGSGEWRLHDTGTDAFTGNVLLNGLGSGTFRTGATSGTATLSAGNTISVGNLGYATGNLVLRNFQQLGSTAQVLALTGSARMEFGAGTTFNGALQATSPYLFFTGATFNGDLFATKTGPAADASSGGNTFNGTAEFKVVGVGALWLNATGTDIFNGNLWFDCVGAGGVFLGMSGGSSVLAAGRTVSIGTDGFNSGVLSFRNFVQSGGTPQSFVLTGSGSLRFQTGTVFNGSLTSSSTGLLLDGGTFNGDVDFIRTGSLVNGGLGGCTFNGTCRIRTTGSGGFYMATSADDTFNGATWFQRLGSGVLSVAYTRDARFRSHVSLLGTSGNVDFGANGGVVRMEGNGDRDYNADPAFPFTVNHLTVNSSIGSKARVYADVTVTGQLAFQSGLIAPMATTSSALGLLILPASNSISTPASNTSYVEGFVRKVGNVPFTFPVGEFGVYAPISISAPSNAAHHFTARYFRVDPDPLYNTALKDASIDHLSRCEYWVLDRTAGSSLVAVTLSWDTPRSCGVQTPAELLVARWDGVMWRNEGNGGTTGNATTGTVVSASTLGQFGPFTLGSTTSSNPLPVELISFDARAVGLVVECEWYTASELNSDHFQLQRSTDDRAFETVAVVPAAGTSSTTRRYNIVDKDPVTGLNYYRLMQVDKDGTRSFSKVVTVLFVSGMLPTLYPNPTSDDVRLHLGQSEGDVTVVVHDSMGRVVISMHVAQTGEDLLLPLAQQPDGTYTIRASDERGPFGTLRVVKW